MESSASGQRNFNTISPSAQALLLLKGQTQIPFARRAAELSIAPKIYHPEVEGPPIQYWGRVLHFENRYWSINQLLESAPLSNILELSSGFSFRGLQLTQQPGIRYIDTDLPDLIATKQSFINVLSAETATGTGSGLQLMPLNALDEAAFRRTADSFPAGPLAIVNEGLLMYLGSEEKIRLCHIIRQTLQARGGYWITADIYLRPAFDTQPASPDDRLSRFFQEHHIYDNMWESEEAAHDFFKDQGFRIDAVAVPDPAKMSVLPMLLQNATPQQQQAMQTMPRMQLTWRLKLR